MLKSNVQTSSGNTKHYIGSVQNGRIIRHKHISDPKYVTIVEGDNGYYLFRYNDADICMSDSWFETLDQAKKQAEFEYAIRSSDWERSEPGHHLGMGHQQAGVGTRGSIGDRVEFLRADNVYRRDGGATGNMKRKIILIIFA